MDAKTPLFPSAFDVKPPKGAEDWQSLYPYYTQFQPSRRAEDDQKFWSDEVQDLTDKAIAAVDRALEAKQAEIMHV